MGLLYNIFTRPQMMELLRFCEEYVRLSDMLITLVDDELKSLENEESVVLSNKSIGKPMFIYENKSVKEIKLEFLKKKLALLNRIPKKYPLSNDIIKQLTKLVREYPNAISDLKLSFKSDTVTIKEMYVNYLFVVKHLHMIKCNIEVNTNRKNK